MRMMKVAEAARLPEPPIGRPQPSGFEVVATLDEIEDLWRAFEEQGVCSPYQRFDWVRSFAQAALAADKEFGIRVLLLRDEEGRPLLLLPVSLRRRHGVAIAGPIGGKHANFNLPIMAQGLSATLTAPDLKRLLIEAGRERLGADAFAFLNQPLDWHGEPNPLAAFGGAPSADAGYKLALEADADRTMARSFSGETRKKMRKKRRSLGDLGELRFWLARRPDEVETILTAFFRQKERRFRELGIANPFAEPMQAFVRAASLAGLDRGRPAIELYALSVGERIVATFGGSGDGRRLCGMFNSFDDSPDVARSSPGELLLADIIRHQCGIGRTVFDLGVGEARYKTSLCDEVEPLIDVLVPVTGRGRLYAAILARLVAAKHTIKRTPWALRAATALRAVRATASA